MDNNNNVSGTVFNFFLTTLPAAFGSFVSLRFMPEGATLLNRIVALISSYLIGSYVGRGIADYYGIQASHISDMIIFGTALFGLSFVANLMLEVKPIVSAASNRIIDRIKGN